MKNKQRWMKRAAVLLLGSALLIPNIGFAETGAYTYTDTSSSVTAGGRDIAFSGDNMVYRASDSEGNTQIYVRRMSTGETKAITDTEDKKEACTIQGDLIVWHQHAGPLIWDIYGYSLATGETKKLNTTSGNFRMPSTDGRYVVWFSPVTIELRLYDWQTGTETGIGKGKDPKAGRGKILFKKAGDGGLSLYDTARPARGQRTLPPKRSSRSPISRWRSATNTRHGSKTAAGCRLSGEPH
ncbi:MAG: hypothetical protein K0Q73_6555 [Paenibacillus sp.]|nr:hypothetical protein [Paenibacillus sp.]